MRLLEMPEFAGRYNGRQIYLCLNLAENVVKHETAEDAKKGVDGQ
jgi:hypothetical protein